MKVSWLGARLALLTSAAMLAFAANSLLCRTALRHTGIDSASFTTTRLVAGAVVLALIVRRRGPGPGPGPAGSWMLIAAVGGVLWLAEPLTAHLLLASAAVLGGVGAVLGVRSARVAATQHSS